MSASMEVMPPGGHETYATSIFSKIKTYLDSNPYKPVKDIPNTPTAIASFDDGSDLPMPKLEVAIEPQQDLHGYDAPWVGGAGKNKLPLILDNIKANNTSGTWNGNTYVHPNGITFNIITNNSGAIEKIVATGTALGNAVLLLDSTTFKPWTGTFIINGCIEGSGSTYFWDMQAETSGNAINYDGDTSFVPNQNYRPRIVITSGYQCPTNGITFKPMIRLASVQDATFAPYSNICPISGWSEADVGVCGKNLFDESILLECSGWTVSDGVYSGESAYVNAKYGNGVPNLAFKPNTQYTFSLTYGQDGSAGIGLAFAIIYTDDTATQKYYTLDTIGFVSVTSTAGKSIKRLELSYGANRTIHLSNMQLEEGTTPSTYEPYNGQTYTIQFKDGDNPLTVYGGSLDVVSGELTVDTMGITINGTETNIYKNNNVPSVYAIFMEPYNIPWVDNGNFTYAQRSKISHFKGMPYVSGAENLVDGTIDSYSGGFAGSGVIGVWFRFKSSQFADFTIEQMKAKFAEYYNNGKPLRFVVPITPQTYQLTPTQVKSLLGNNNVWADTGDIKDGKYVVQDYSDITSKVSEFAQHAITASKLGSSNVGSATQPIYLNGGTATACTYTLGKSVPSDAVFTDTKNTAGSTDTSSKIFLIGATSQAANPQTYSQDTAYVGTDGCLYSGGTKVLTAHQDISGKADKSATVSMVAWSNNKLTKTINGTTSDVVSAATILGNLTSSQVTTALGYTPASVNTTYDFESPDDSISFNGRAVGSVVTVDMTVNGKVSTEGDTISGDYVNTADFSESGVYGKRVTTYGPWGIDVEEYLADSLWSRLSLRDSDILLTKTWDGTNTSLKSSISSLNQSLSHLNIEELWTGSKYTTGDIQLSKATKTNDVLILSFRGFSVSMTQQFPILIQSGVTNYQVSYWGDASQFGRYRLVITNNSKTFTIKNVTNGSANSALIGIYRVRTS